MEADLGQKIAKLADGVGPWGVVLEGEPGIGKSHLANRVSENASAEVKVIRADADPILRPSLRPCWVLLNQLVNSADDLRRLAARTENPIVGDALRRGAPYLAAGLGLDWPDAREQALDAEAVLRLTIDGLVAAFRLAAESAPLLIHLEDIHWIDDDSRTVVGRLLTRATEPIGVLMTARPRPRHLAEETAVDVRPIERLDDDSITELAESLLDDVSSQRLNTVLAERSAGIPLFVTQLVRDLQDRGLIVLVDGVWHLADRFEEDQLPGGARALLVSRIDRLPEEARAAVAISSILGGGVSAELVGAVADTVKQQKLDDPHRALARAAKDGVMVEDAPGQWAFSHALFRDAAYEMQLTSGREHLHRIAAALLEDQGAPAAVLAEHYDRGGLIEKALAYHRTAGEAASASYQNEAAAWHLGRALALMDEDAVQARFDLALALDKVFGRVSDHVRQEGTPDLLVALADKLDAEARLRAVLAQIEHFRARGDYETCAQLLDDSTSYAAQFEGTALAVRYHNLGAHCFLFLNSENREHEAKQHAATAVRMARKANDPEVLAQALYQDGSVHRYADDPIAAARFEEALAATNDPALRSTLLHRLGSIAFRREEAEKGKELSAAALVLAREIGSQFRVGHQELGLGFQTERFAEIAAAEAHFRAALAIGKELRDGVLVTEGTYGLGFSARLAGRVHEASRVLGTLSMSDHATPELLASWTHFKDYATGDLETYLPYLGPALEYAVRTEYDHLELELLVSICQVDALLGRTTQYEMHKDRIEDVFSRGEDLLPMGQTRGESHLVRPLTVTHLIQRALVHLMAGDREAAWQDADIVVSEIIADSKRPRILDVRDGLAVGSEQLAISHHMLANVGHPAAPAMLADSVRRLNELADRVEAAGYPRADVWRENAFRAYLVEAATADNPRSLIEVLAAYRKAPAATKA